MHQPALFLSEAADSDVIWCTSRLIWHRRKQKTITVKLWTKCEPTRSATSKLITKKKNKIKQLVKHVFYNLGSSYKSNLYTLNVHQVLFHLILSYTHCHGFRFIYSFKNKVYFFIASDLNKCQLIIKTSSLSFP